MTPEQPVDQEKLYAAAEEGDTATMLCPTCGKRTPVVEWVMLLGLWPECAVCHNTALPEEANLEVTRNTDEHVRILR
jgi:hypothetical protein